MKINKKAFTLVELLVVVLIIGILAAIAVPNYMVATKTAKVKGYMTILKALHDAQKIYFLGHNTYTNKLSGLDVHVDYDEETEYEYGKGFRSVYDTSWGRFTLYTMSSNIDSVINFGEDSIYLSFYGENLNNPNDKDYWLCFNNDEVCSKLGGEIYVPAKSHWTGTNVYYITK